LTNESEAASLPHDLLVRVLDLLIPPSADGRLPGAGELGLARYIEALLATTPGPRPLVAQGLAALEAAVSGRGARSFAALPREAQCALLDELGHSVPGFAPTLLFLVMTGYYREPRVLAALGLEDRAPFPKGHAVAESDFSLLDAVRRRGKLYRAC
jgi:hypothetical protein